MDKRMVLIPTATALAGALVAAVATGWLMDTDPVEVVRCNVNDQKLAEVHRAREVGLEVEKLIDQKMRLVNEIAGYELKRKGLIGELGLLETQVVDTKLFVEDARAALAASKKTSAFDRR